jgi:putative oxidoreductase
MLHVPRVAGDFSALLIRVVVGVAFIVSSKNKSKNIKKFAKNNGLPVPMATAVMIAEMAGGLGLISGVFAPYAALGLMLLMLGTIRLHIFKWRSPYWASSGGWEYDLMLFALASVILIHGSGNFAILP